MIRRSIGAAFLLLVSILCSQAYATHIQYVDLADVENVEIAAGETWTWTFKLLDDDMYLWEIASPTDTYGPTPDLTTADSIGSYDSDYLLHYVTLRIDPNNYTGNPTSNYIELKVNGSEIASWKNPISLYDWGVPGGVVSDEYGIATSDYEIKVTLTGLSTLSSSIGIENVNLEGCFDTGTHVPEPATMILLGSGLVGLGVLRKRLRKK